MLPLVQPSLETITTKKVLIINEPVLSLAGSCFGENISVLRDSPITAPIRHVQHKKHHLKVSTDSTCAYSPSAEKLKMSGCPGPPALLIVDGSMKKRVQLYCGKAFLA